MISPPPTGSNISVTMEGPEIAIKVPHPNSSTRYLFALFLLFWLGGWTFGFIQVSSTLLSGRGGAFIIFWLGAWTLGGLYAVYALYRIVRPSVPEIIRLKTNSAMYDSGVPPFQMSFGDASRKDAWKSLFPRRTRLELSRQQLQTLRLRSTDSSNRLTIDAGAQRIDIAQSATEIEREWLYRMLAGKYAVPPSSRPSLHAVK